MYQKDRNEDRFVLVWNRFDTLEFELIGWLYGAEAKAAGIWLADHGFWIVRPPYRPIDDLLQK
jgi:hypothetical protein